jgi:hypothetical protein
MSQPKQYTKTSSGLWRADTETTCWKWPSGLDSRPAPMSGESLPEFATVVEQLANKNLVGLPVGFI